MSSSQAPSKITFGGGRGVNGMECYFHFEHGFCKWGDHCKYSHLPTGFRAEAPHQDEYGATAGSNARRKIRVYTKWQGQTQPVVYHSRYNAESPLSTQPIQAQTIPIIKVEDLSSKQETDQIVQAPQPSHAARTVQSALHSAMEYDNNRGYPIKGRDEVHRKVRPYDLEAVRSRSRSPLAVHRSPRSEARASTQRSRNQESVTTRRTHSPSITDQRPRIRPDISSERPASPYKSMHLQNRWAGSGPAHYTRQQQRPLSKNNGEDAFVHGTLDEPNQVRAQQLDTEAESSGSGSEADVQAAAHKYDPSHKASYSSEAVNKGERGDFHPKSTFVPSDRYYTSPITRHEDLKHDLMLDIQAAKAISAELDNAHRWLSGASHVAQNVTFLLSRVRNIAGSGIVLPIPENLGDQARTAAAIMQPLSAHMALWKNEVNRCVERELLRLQGSSQAQDCEHEEARDHMHVENEKAFI